MVGWDSMKSAYYRVFGTHSDRELKKLRPLVRKISSMEAQMEAMSDADLKAFTPKFKEILEIRENAR